MHAVSVIVSFEGVNLSSGYVVREMSIFYLIDKSYRHYFFDLPDNLFLTERDKQTDRYYYNVLGGISLRTVIEGALPYITLDYLLLHLADHYIYVAGNVSCTFLREKLPYHSNITDIREISFFVYPRTLESAGCGLNHRARYCSLAKLKAVKDFCDENF
jgi:hypothetical protein